MKAKVHYLLGGFVAFYFLMHIAYDLPNLLYHVNRVQWIPYNLPTLLAQVMSISAGFLFALLPYLVLHYNYPTGKYIRGIITFILPLIPIVYINYTLAQLLNDKNTYIRYFFSTHLFYFSIYIVYGVVFYFVRYAQYKQLEQKELLLQNRQAELSFLHSQINPHFLFNSLNNIYALVYQGSGQALQAIAGLSELLRYMLYDSNEKVALKKEWEYIQKYIELQKLRFDYPVRVNMHVSGAVDQVLLPPLLLIPFVENAFKHGDFSGDDAPLAITLYTTSLKTNFHCYNKKGKGNKDAGGGIGLANVKRRLSLLFPDKHLLYIEDNADSFTVTLEVLHD